jgi:carbamate kinase
VRVVVALGGNALLRRGQPLSAAVQRQNVQVAARALAPVALRHQLVISHGNGPQVGLLALQSSASPDVAPYPLDVLGAETEGMIGYLIEQELGNLVPFEVPLATILTMVEVLPDDPAFAEPSKPIGPAYTEEEAKRLAARNGWTVKPDDDGATGSWRRVVASPVPRRIFEIRPVKWLLDRGTIVICAGGGGIPTMYLPGTRTLVGAQVVVDKDRASALLARELQADVLVMATDADAVYLGWGTPAQRALASTTPQELERHTFAAGSMAPKVEAACEFVGLTGGRAAIGALRDVERMVEGTAGTQVRPPS